MRTLRNVGFVFLLVFALFSGPANVELGAFYCPKDYFNYGFHFSDCGPFGGEEGACGYVEIDCYAECWYISMDYSFDCDATLVDEQSELWTVSGTCTCEPY